jgi:transposase
MCRACKVMGFSRDTFYRYQAAVADGGLDALLNANRKKPNLRNRTEESIESAVVAFAVEQPAFGQVRVSNELRKRGIFVSASGVRSVWLRHDLESFKKRLNGPSQKSPYAGPSLRARHMVNNLDRPK